MFALTFLPSCQLCLFRISLFRCNKSSTLKGRISDSSELSVLLLGKSERKKTLKFGRYFVINVLPKYTRHSQDTSYIHWFLFYVQILCHVKICHFFLAVKKIMSYSFLNLEFFTYLRLHLALLIESWF